MNRTAREALAGFGIGAVGCGAWLLGMVAWANPEEARTVIAVVAVVACWAVVIVGLVGEGCRWR